MTLWHVPRLGVLVISVKLVVIILINHKNYYCGLYPEYNRNVEEHKTTALWEILNDIVNLL